MWASFPQFHGHRSFPALISPSETETDSVSAYTELCYIDTHVVFKRDPYMKYMLK